MGSLWSTHVSSCSSDRLSLHMDIQALGCPIALLVNRWVAPLHCWSTDGLPHCTASQQMWKYSVHFCSSGVVCVVCVGCVMWDYHTPGHPSVSDEARNVSCALGDCLTCRPESRSQPGELWFLFYSWTCNWRHHIRIRKKEQGEEERGRLLGAQQG